jgi:peptide/nickel transport system permease protein
MKSNLEVKKQDERVVKKEEEIQSPTKIIFKRLKKNKLALIGLGVLVFVILFCVIGPWISPYEMNGAVLKDKYLPPSSTHWLGTDQVGRDILTRIMYGGRVSLLIGVLAELVAVILGASLGCIAGYYGGIVDTIIMRIVDVMLCMPTLPILIILGASLTDIGVPADKRMYFIMLILGFLTWSGLCRLVRGQILTLREQEFMQATEALGLTDNRKIFKHLLPNVIPIIIVSATLGIGGTILYESTLSYIGLGVTPPAASWGNMLTATRNMFTLQKRPWIWIPPGMAILFTVMAINFFGDGLRDAIDPKMKR